MRILAFSLIFLLPLSGFGAVVVAPTVNDLNGCQKGNAPEVAQKQCGDFDVAHIKDRNPSARAAYDKCLVFYEKALRIQNTFCSYRMDSVVFTVATESPAAQSLGEASVAEQKIAEDNQNVAEITSAYRAKLKQLAPEFKSAYEQYQGAIGKLNGGGGTDEVYEATCWPKMVDGQVPGLVRELLAAQSYLNAHATYDSIWMALRNSMQSLKTVQEQAESNRNKAKLRAVDVGSVLQKTLEEPTRTPTAAPSPLDGAVSGGMQLILSQAAEKTIPAIGATGAAVIGGGLVLVYQIATNKVVMYPETTASFIAMLNPYAGIAATMVVAIARTVQADVQKYRTFATSQLKFDVNMSSMKLMKLYAQSTQNAACVKKIEQEEACIEKRKTAVPYEHDDCYRSAVTTNSYQKFQSPNAAPANNSSTITGPTN